MWIYSSWRITMKPLAHWFLLGTFSLVWIIKDCKTLFFPQTEYYGVLTSGGAGSLLLKVYAIKNRGDSLTAVVNYTIKARKANTSLDRELNSYFKVTDDGWIYLARPLPRGDRHTVILYVAASLSLGSENHKEVIVPATLERQRNGWLGDRDRCSSSNQRADQNQCFGGNYPVAFHFQDAIYGVAFGRLRQLEPCPENSLKYYIHSDIVDANSFISINSTTSELSLKNTLDWGKFANLSFNVTCTVRSTSGFSITHSQTVIVRGMNSETEITSQLQDGFEMLKNGKNSTERTFDNQRSQSFLSANLLRNASLYSRIIQLSTRIPNYDEDTRFAVDSNVSSTRAFQVTPETGIVYVNNATSLRLMKNKSATLSISVLKIRGGNVTEDGNVEVLIDVLDAANFPDGCEKSCSFHDIEETCTGQCGLGSPGGRCRMRTEKLPSMSTRYATCSPELSTCPDNQCDELEDVYPLVCPQDCTFKVVGEAKLNTNYYPPRGILVGRSPCKCDRNADCMCMRIVDNFSPANGNRALGATSIPASKTVESASKAAIKQQKESQLCGGRCKSAVAAGFGSVVFVTVIALVAWWLWSRRRKRSDSLKHVSSVVSMTAVPSDYVESQDRHFHRSVYDFSLKCLHPDSLLIEKKWEFPRKHLALEEAIGEGEFGMVVRARAYQIEGKSACTTVAVKMLKECASSSEFRDLWSEFNLLKEVNHPNVIRLLGVCAYKGPFYVIVEYCEHGSLKNFLKKYRLRGMGQSIPACCHRNDGGPTDCNALTSRDLLSFAWQVCKGMQYLSQIKLVHRDLAARNVLIASGNVIKISDFGLTRDIYEADAYMKKSKGRIPVKWMAPESLYAQVYTSKSDVWSFGILLWEIVTLGANPYPGILPERLFSLLKTGYRMDRPENCSEEIYAVMQKCWKSEPTARPAFDCLADSFDRMLQEKTGYLRLDGFFERSGKDSVGVGEGKHNLIVSYGNDTEDGYGSISVFPTDVNSYITPVVPDYKNSRDDGIGVDDDVANVTDDQNSLEKLLLENADWSGERKELADTYSNIMSC